MASSDVREFRLLRFWLGDRRRAARHQAIAAFAAEHAGTKLDFDPEFGAAAIEDLMVIDEDYRGHGRVESGRAFDLVAVLETEYE